MRRRDFGRAGLAALIATKVRGAPAQIVTPPLPIFSGGFPIGATGVWYADQYDAAKIAIPNARGSALSANIYRAPRRLFADPNNSFWQGSGTTIVDNAVAAPDASTEASTLVGTGNWFLHSTVSGNVLPAGTYTIAVNAKRNTGSDQQFAFSGDNTATRSSPMTATAAWQRFSYTFVRGSLGSLQTILLCSIDGATGANIQICDLELFAGSADLGPEVCSGDLYLGTSQYSLTPSYASGAVDMSAGAVGLIQLSPGGSLSISSTGITAMALLSKVGAGDGSYQAFLSKIQSYSTFSAFTEITGSPYGFDASTQFNTPGLWPIQGKGYHAFAQRYDGTNLELWLDDIKLFSKAASLSNFSLQDFAVNFVNILALYGGYSISSMALWPRALSYAEVRSAVVLLQARAATSGISATNWARTYVAVGDSITGGFTYSYPYKFGPNASPAILGANYGVSGYALADLNTHAALIDSIVPPNKGSRKFILSVLVGANDLASYSGGYTQFAIDLAAYCNARRLAGWVVVICTLTPQTNAGFNTARNLLNPELRLWTTGGSIVADIHADAIADFAADPTMGPDAAASNTTYYADGLHPTDAGMALLEAVIRPVINGL